MQLQRVVFRLRRAVRSRLRADGSDAEVPDSQAEVLHLIRRTPGLRVQDVAERLSIAPNTASTLVGQLLTAGLIQRRRDAADARVARLQATREATARVARVRDRGATVVEGALEYLEPRDRERIRMAIPAFQRLLDVIEGLSAR